VANPDEQVAHRPGGDCACGADLRGATDVGVERSHQVHDLPEIEIKVLQHDVYRVRCGCGREHVAALPEEVSPAPSSYGLNVRSLVVYLLIYQHVPVGRVVELIADLTGGAGPSAGFVHGMLTRCAGAVADVVALIKTLITAAHVVGASTCTRGRVGANHLLGGRPVAGGVSCARPSRASTQMSTQVSTRAVASEFVFDRHGAAELSVAYRILVPERRLRVGAATEEVSPHEQRSDLRPGVLCPAEGAADDRLADRGAARPRRAAGA